MQLVLCELGAVDTARKERTVAVVVFFCFPENFAFLLARHL